MASIQAYTACGSTTSSFSPCTTNHGQGGAMAVEDAVVLAGLLDADFPDVPTLLQAFGERRLPACRFVQDRSRAVGEAGAVEDADSVARRNAAMPQTAQQQVDDFYRTLSELG